ncbi:hypothetical protein Patl1_23641 [Pistacia atlantica]|uniref:Uncharacterized protein n=1 Tax=Pistacia atlantica TaxID=434234 RepID=A0ACC0ZTW3_9ROSI|nr:hypothetical protein Patl1_23641 [Pistacia atlantica]
MARSARSGSTSLPPSLPKTRPVAAPSP